MKLLLAAALTLGCVSWVADCFQDGGFYRPDLYPYDDGKYHPIGDEGKYYHVGDGDRGPYREGYEGGYGKYFGSKFDTKGQYKKPVVTTPKYDEGGSRIIQQKHGFRDDGYHHFFETENGIFHVENGKILNQGTDAETIDKNGFYEYTGTDGVLHRVEYSAGAHGFLVKAARLPAKPRPTPRYNTPRPLHDAKMKGLLPFHPHEVTATTPNPQANA